ncbi:MAG TPA: O-methyltransferase [Planctomycetota bacterium]|nr:O-methyltransferase [Planctomycetota bacterium]
METINPVFRQVDDYIEELFTKPDAALVEAIRVSDAAGLPEIHVSPNEGKVLFMLAKICGANRILEIGLLGGYSTIFLARALPPDGKVVSLELEERHAAVARKNLERAGVSARCDIRVGSALDTLARMHAANEAPFDFIFIDADKDNYPAYFDSVMSHFVHSGSVIVGDNVIRNGRVLEDAAGDSIVRGVQIFNRKMAEDPRLESIAIPLIRVRLDGIAVARVK